MTEEEFDQADFCCTDQIEVRHYFGHAIEDVKWVDFGRREVNGYVPIEIIRHIKKTQENGENGTDN